MCNTTSNQQLPKYLFVTYLFLLLFCISVHISFHYIVMTTVWVCVCVCGKEWAHAAYVQRQLNKCNIICRVQNNIKTFSQEKKNREVGQQTLERNYQWRQLWPKNKMSIFYYYLKNHAILLTIGGNENVFLS